MLKALVVLLLVSILGSLFSALFSLYKGPVTGERTVRLLTWRIVLSIALFGVLLLAFRLGAIPGYSQ